MFIKRNIETPNERNVIMQVICETMVTAGTGEAVKQVKLAAFECVVRMADLYYNFLPEYMTALGQLTFNAISHEEEAIGRMAIEFWCTLCDEEIERLGELADCENQSLKPTVTVYKFIEAASMHLIPLLLQQVARLSDDEDDDDNIASSAGTCLTLVANTIRDPAVDSTLPFINQNVASPDWRLKACAILTFGYVLEGPSEAKINPLITQALPVLIMASTDRNTRVKDATAWTLSRVCEFHAKVAQPYLNDLAIALLQCLKEVPRVANNACWAVRFISMVSSRGCNLGLTYWLWFT